MAGACSYRRTGLSANRAALRLGPRLRSLAQEHIMCRSPEALPRRAAALRHRYHCPSRGCLVNRSSLTGVATSSTKSDLIYCIVDVPSERPWRQSIRRSRFSSRSGSPPHDDVREEVAGPSRGRSHGTIGSCCRPVIALAIPRPAGLLDGLSAVF